MRCTCATFWPAVGEMMGSEAPWRSLQPASVLINLLPDLGRTARQLWWLLPAMLVGGGFQRLVDFGFLLFFLAMSFFRTLTHYMTLRYRVSEGRLELVEGLLFRQHRLIDPARIQNMEIVRNIFHRMAGLAELRIDTAGEGGAEGLLSAISLEEANQLRTALADHQPGSEATEEEEELRTGFLELLAYGFSSARSGAAIVAVSVGYELLFQFSPQMAGDAAARIGSTGMVGLLLVAVAGSTLVSAATAIRSFWGLRLLKNARGLVTEAGLFTRSRVEVPQGKVQLVQVDEPLSRRIFGYGTIQVETAGSSAPIEGESRGELMLPMVQQAALAWVASLALPALDVDPWKVTLRPAAPRALLRALLGAGLRWALICLPIAIAFRDPTPFLFWPIGPISAFFDWRRQGWYLTESVLVSRRGFFRRQTSIISLEKLQALRLEEGPLMQVNRLGRVVVRVAGGEVALPDLNLAEARQIFEKLQEKTTQRTNQTAPNIAITSESTPTTTA